MTNYISQAEAEELCEAMLRQYLGRDAPVPQSVDIDGFVRDYLKCTILYEAFAEDDPNKIGFTGDGRTPLIIRRDGQTVSVVFPFKTMDIVRDIQKNYRLPYPPRTIGEKIAEARQQSGAEKLKGHDIMALERFDPEVRHMIVFDVLSYDSPVGDRGDKMRLFLTDAGYQKFLDSQERGEVKLKNHAKVSGGHLHYDRRDRAL